MIFHPSSEESTAKHIFTTIIKYKNLMTPDVIGYYETDNMVIELSSGRGITGETMYGVTVIKDGKHSKDLCCAFYSKEKAIDYIEKLK